MRFNKRQTNEDRVQSHPDLTTNHEGGIAFKVTPELELYLRACVGLFEDKFYKAGSDALEEIKAMVAKCDRDFVLKLASFARNDMYLRSMPVMLLAEASCLPQAKDEKPGMVRAYVPKICTRADQPAELLAYMKNHLQMRTRKNLTFGIKRGLSDTLNRFNEYQLQKWDVKGRDFKLKDVIQVVHPNPKDDEQSAIFKRALNDEMKTAETWETHISVNGASTKTWNEISEKMPIMAMMRNLRNFEKHDAKKALKRAKEMLRNPEIIQRSKQFPFRFMSALDAVEGNDVKDAVREAIELSVANLPKWSGDTAVFSDLSGSMGSKLSERSTMRYIDVASVMGALACHLSQENYLVGAFGESYQDVQVSRRDSVLTNAEKIRKTNVGHSTNAFLCLQRLIDAKAKFDRIFIFSDMQCYDSTGAGYGWGYSRKTYKSLQELWLEYQQKVNRDAILYSVDLAGYGTSQFPEDASNVVQLAGWSDKIFKFVDAFEKRYTMVQHVKDNW